MKIDRTNTETIRATKRATRTNFDAVKTAYDNTVTGTPADTVKMIVDTIGYDAAVITVAEIVNTVGDWDGRIYDYIRDWAKSIDEAMNATELDENGFYTPSIHSCHINEIAYAIREYTPETTDTTETDTADTAEEEKPEEEEEEEPRDRDEIVRDIIDVLNDVNTDLDEIIEQLDWYDGYLNDDRYYSMDEFDEILSGKTPYEIARMTFYGDDADHGGNGFNPNADFFRLDGYGNLVSTNYKDYSDYIDEHLVDDLADNRRWVDAIDENERLSALFDELDEAV